jgi:hypothetical protein
MHGFGEIYFRKLKKIEADEILAFLESNSQEPVGHWGMLRGEASIIIKRMQATPSSLRYAPASGRT